MPAKTTKRKATKAKAPNPPPVVRRKRRPEWQVSDARAAARAQLDRAYSDQYVGFASGSYSATVKVEGRSVYQTPDDALRYERDKLVDISRRLHRNNALYAALINRAVDFILGTTGPTLHMMTGDKARDEAIERQWRDWWRDPEVRGTASGYELTRHFLSTLLLDGDNVTLRAEEGRVQLVESYRYGGLNHRPPKIPKGSLYEDGLEMTPTGRLLRVHISDAEYGENSVGRTQAVPVELGTQAHYAAYRTSAAQTRGYPALQSAFTMLDRLGDVFDSEAAAWQLLSRMALAVTKQGAEESAFGNSTVDPGAQTGEAAPRIQLFDEAIIFNGEPGDEIKGIDRNIPGANFEASVKMFARLIGLPLGFPLEFVLLLWSDTNYSSGRAGIKQTERNLRPWISQLSRWADQLLAWKLEEWGEDELTPDSWEWRYPPYPFIDPEKEAQAAQARIESGLSNRTREAKENGVEFPDIVAEQVEELRVLAEQKRQLEADYPGATVTIEGGRLVMTPAAETSGVDENGNPISAGAPLNGAQITAAVDVMNKLREGVLVPQAAQALLEAVGLPPDKAAGMVQSTPIGRDDSAADVGFKREVVKQLVADGTLGDAVFNLLDARGLLDQVNIPVSGSAVEEPWMPIIADNGEKVSGGVIVGPQGEIVGGDTLPNGGSDNAAA